MGEEKRRESGKEIGGTTRREELRGGEVGGKTEERPWVVEGEGRGRVKGIKGSGVEKRGG